jgi:SpoIID/LytB domain protein
VTPTPAPVPTPTTTATAAPTPAPTSAPVPTFSGAVTYLGAATTFYGRGYGHGVGLSQYGAQGRALAGQLAPEILAHYYAGTTLGTYPTDAAIRVLVLDNFAASAAVPLTIYGRGGDWTVAGTNQAFPADARLCLVPTTANGVVAWQLTITATDGTTLLDAPVAGELRIQPASDTTVLQLFSKPTNFDRYRGDLRVLFAASTADVINELPLETYLRGVVPAEMPSAWPVEARIAQTIAARSYAAYRIQPGIGTFDIYDDTRSQVYLGALRETAASDAVVAATAGQILRNGSAIANTLFHSTAGGATENNENVFTSATGARTSTVASYLRGSSDRDPNGVPYDAASPWATWQSRAYTPDELSMIFGADARTNVGTLTSLDLHDRGVSGRLVSVTLMGSAGSKIVSGNLFVAIFNAHRPSGDPMLRSSLLNVAPIP